jgi:hypothetical protein
MGRDFWILVIPVCVLSVGASASVLVQSAVPFAAAFAYLGLHAVVYCRRLAPFLHSTALWSVYTDRSLFGPPSPLRIAALGALMALVGAAAIAFETAGSLGIIEIRRQ